MPQEREEGGFAVIGVSKVVQNDDPSAIAGLWEAFRSNDIRTRIGADASGEIYCVYHEYEGDFRDPYRMTIGYRLPLEAPPEGLHRVEIPRQWMASYEVRGPQPQSVIAQWQDIWNGNLNRSYGADYDVYDTENPETVCIKVGVRRS